MIGFVVLNYISWDDSLRCIESILCDEFDEDFRVYLVDNASPISPGRKMMEIVNSSKVYLIQNRENLGYARGNNVGIEVAINDGCQAVLVVNSDVIFLKGSIKEMLEFLKQRPKVGIVGPRVLDSQGVEQRSRMLIKTGLREKYLFRTILRKLFPRIQTKYFGEYGCTSPEVVHAVSGCCFMISRECALSLSPVFDENTFLYEEEFILGIRMNMAGFETVYLPNSTVVHLHGQSSKHIKAFSFIEFVRSEIHYCKSYLGASTISIIPLYMIRFSSYVSRVFFSKDFLKTFPSFLRRTIPSLFTKDGLRNK